MTPSRSPFASASVPRHLARGGTAVLTMAGSVQLFTAGGVLGTLGGLLAGGLAVFLLRGCPMCWLVGLVETATGPACCEVRPPARPIAPASRRKADVDPA